MTIDQLPKHVLLLILNRFKKEFAHYDNPSIVDVYEYNSITEEIDFILNSMGLPTPDHIEYGFLWLLYMYNKDKKEGEDLIIPRKKKLSFEVNVDVTKFATEIYGHQTVTYSDDDSFNKTMIYSDEDWNLYDGDYIDDNIYDSESGEWELKNLRTSLLKESTYNKKVITEDKKRRLKILLKQREQIENEIRKLTT